MAIHNFNGSDPKKEVFSSIDRVPDFRSDVEKTQSPLSAHQDKVDIGLVERQAQEAINVAGAVVIIYPKMEHGGFDPVWEEDADPIYGNGLRMKGFFKPQPITSDLTKWGVDTNNKVEIVFPRAILLKEFGERLLTIGDVILTPQNSLVYKAMRNYRITNVAETGMYMYRWIYITVAAELITGDESLEVKHE